MARMAILYDVHGNLPALEAVLVDLRGAGAERVLLGGDYALFDPFPAETVRALRELADATWIRGNVDRWCADPGDAPDELARAAIADCREALGIEVVQELAGLQEQVVIDATRYCHASPLSDVRSFMPAPGPDDDELLAGVPERRIVFGHTHLAFRRVREDGVELVNPGSVGMPWDGDRRAAYAVLGDDGSIEHRRVEYDVEAAAVGVLERFGGVPWAARSADRLRRAAM